MEFTSARPDIVQAINQRWLLKFWNDTRDGRTLPVWQQLDGRELAAMAENLSFTDVVRGNGEQRYLIRYHGKRIGEAYGSDCHGRHLDEIIPESYRDAALATYHQVVDGRRPVYTSFNTVDRAGRVVHFERLLLPFGSDGKSVDRILASLETVCPDGAFDNRNLMVARRTPSSFSVCAVIDPMAG